MCQLKLCQHDVTFVAYHAVCRFVQLVPMRAHTIIHLMTEGKQNDQPYRSRDLIIDTLLSLLIHFSLKQRRARRFHAPSLTLLPSSLTPERSHRAPFSRPSKVTAADSPLHHGAASVVDAAEPPLAELYSEHTPWPPARVHQ